MTETPTLLGGAGEPAAEPVAKTTRRRGTGLNAMVLPELQQIASGLGIKGVGKMRKGALIEAIQSAQGGSTTAAPARTTAPEVTAPEASAATTESAPRTETREDRGQQARADKRDARGDKGSVEPRGASHRAASAKATFTRRCGWRRLRRRFTFTSDFLCKFPYRFSTRIKELQV